MTTLIRRRQMQWCCGCTLVGALAWLVFGSPPRCLAATSGAALGVSVVIAPQLTVDGQGAASSEVVSGTAMPAGGIPFQIRVRSNAPWQWSARVASVSDPAVPLRCDYDYRPVAALGGAPGGPGQIELGLADGAIPGAPLPRGEVVLEGRVVLPPGVHPRTPWNVTLVWTVTQVDVNVGQPLTWTTSARVCGTEAPATTPASAR